MASVFSFLVDIIQLETRSHRSPDKVIFFFVVLHVLDYDNNSHVSDDDKDDNDNTDDGVVVVMVLCLKHQFILYTCNCNVTETDDDDDRYFNDDDGIIIIFLCVIGFIASGLLDQV